MVLITSGACGACAGPSLPGTVAAAVESLRDQAAAYDLPVKTLAIGVDRDPAAGVAQIGRFGEFDQLAVGGGWEGLGVMTYVWERHPGRAAVPQILVLHRSVESVASRILGARESLLRRIVGLDALAQWERQGFTVDLERARAGSF